MERKLGDGVAKATAGLSQLLEEVEVSFVLYHEVISRLGRQHHNTRSKLHHSRVKVAYLRAALGPLKQKRRLAGLRWWRL